MMTKVEEIAKRRELGYQPDSAEMDLLIRLALQAEKARKPAEKPAK